MKKLIAALLMVGVTARLAPAAAQEEGVNKSVYFAAPDKTSDIIEYPDSDGCLLRMGYENSFLSLAYNAKTKIAIVRFVSKEATSIKNDEKKKLNIMFLVTPTREGDTWEDTDFTAKINEDGSRYFTSEPLNSEFIDSFAKSVTVAFFYGENLVESFNLAGSAKLVSKLKDCSMMAGGINPNDPFTK